MVLYIAFPLLYLCSVLRTQMLNCLSNIKSSTGFQTQCSLVTDFWRESVLFSIFKQMLSDYSADDVVDLTWILMYVVKASIGDCVDMVSQTTGKN